MEDQAPMRTRTGTDRQLGASRALLDQYTAPPRNTKKTAPGRCKSGAFPRAVAGFTGTVAPFSGEAV